MNKTWKEISPLDFLENYFEWRIPLGRLEEQCKNTSPELIAIFKKLWELSEEEKKTMKYTLKYMKNRLNLELVYKNSLSKLRSKFPNIPEDLTNKSVNIKYLWENWVYINIYLFNDRIHIPWDSHGPLDLHKSESWKFSMKKKWFLNWLKFNQRIDDIIKNADKCEIEIKDLDRPRIPTKE